MIQNSAFRKIMELLLLTIIPIGLLLLTHDTVLEMCDIRVRDLNWGISLRYYLYVFSIGLLIHNLIFIFLRERRYSIYIFAVICFLLILLLTQIMVHSFRSCLLIVSTLVSLVLPFETYKFLKRLKNK